MDFNSLLCELKEEKNAKGDYVIQKYVSLGRVSFWLLFIILNVFWFRDVTVPDSLYDVFFIILLYNFSKKPLELFKDSKIIRAFRENMTIDKK